MTPPANIAHYRITAKLGEGGMGAVYRATDTKLHREVAIKVLPDALAADPDRMARFEREAQVLASLNHPNIATIYGIEQGAIVMELVEGAEPRGPLPEETVIDYARQIAAGLEAAHEKSVVHRDLKPANIRVTTEGTVKLLDFGLAKAAQLAVAAAATQSPTASLSMTQAGVVVGTAAYMAPEQARGQTIDRRADIWAFGTVVYELITGKQLFAGPTFSDTLASVLRQEIDLSAIPPRFRRLLRACLERDPRSRLQSIGDMRLLLDEPESARPAHSKSRWMPWAAVPVALAAGFAAATFWPRPHTPEAVQVRFPLPLPQGTTHAPAPASTQAVPSPDGRYIAFVAVSDGGNFLWIRSMAFPSAHKLDNTEGANFPFWSADGQSIGFFAGDKLKRIPFAGGVPQVICNLPDMDAGINGDGATWNADGVIVFSSGRSSPLYRVLAAGGSPTAITKVDESAGELKHIWPEFLRDGRHLLYLAANRNQDNSAVYVQEMGSPQRTLVMRNRQHAVWSPPDFLLFPRLGRLFAQHIDEKSFQLSGEPVAIADDVAWNNGGRSAFAASRNGVLIFHGDQQPLNGQLAWYDREGKRLGAIGQQGSYYSVRLSPDDKSAELVVGFASLDAWIINLATGVMTRVTNMGQGKSLSAWIGPWSPDSQHMAINVANSGGVLLANLSSGTSRQFAKGFYADDWLPDNSAILGRDFDGKQVLLLTPDGGSPPRPIHSVPYPGQYYRLSPNGKLIAYVSTESGTSQIYVARFPSFEDRRQVSVNGGLNAAWKNNSKELFFLGPDSMLMSAEIESVDKLEPGTPHPLFRIPQAGGLTFPFSPTSDGKRFLVIEGGGMQSPEMMVVVNWMAGFK